MDERIEKWFYDMLTAIAEIESFFVKSPKHYADFCRDIRTQRAVERNIEIIGEAMSRILKTDPAISLYPMPVNRGYTQLYHSWI